MADIAPKTLVGLALRAYRAYEGHEHELVRDMVEFNSEQRFRSDGSYQPGFSLGMITLVMSLLTLIAVIVLALLPGILNEPTAQEVLAPSNVQHISATHTE